MSVALSTPPSLLAVDPGKSTCGVALFLSRRLRETAFLKAENTYMLGKAVEDWLATARQRYLLPDVLDQLVTEGQQVYGGRSADPNDLLPLAYLCGAIHVRIKAHQTLMPLPREWKGSLKKEIFTKQILLRLHKDELTIINETKCPPSKLHNVIDAAGLGLWALGSLRDSRGFHAS